MPRIEGAGRKPGQKDKFKTRKVKGKRPRKRGRKAQPVPSMTPTDLIELGTTVYGQAWRARVSERYGINRSTISRWLNDQVPWERRMICAALVDALKYLQEHPEEA